MTITEQIRQDLINIFRQILMSEDTECGNEVLCTIVAERCADVAMYYIDELYSSRLILDIELEKMIKHGNNK